MSKPAFHQHFGPSRRFDRACIEMRFPLSGETVALAEFEPLLLDLGFTLRGHLPSAPRPLDEAVRRLAGALLARHMPWWSRSGAVGDRGWAAIAHPFPTVSSIALRTAYRLIVARGEAVAPDVMADLRSLSAWLTSTKIGVWALGAAQALGRDAITLVDSSEVYQVGHGAKGVHGYRMGTQFDPITGHKLESSKFTTVQLLDRLGLPTTRPVLVNSPEEVPAAVARVGLPCVVKPLDLLQGQGVSPGLASEAAVVAAVERALARSKPPVQIENHVEGEGYRLIVIGHELAWVYRRTPTSVTGDGTATVGELIERENRRRLNIRSYSDGYLRTIATDDALQRLLADRHGLRLDSVPEAGRGVQVVAQANIAQGAVQEDVTGAVHPDNRALAIKVSRLFRLRSTGIDFITPDIARSWREVPCAIIEVNRLPGVEGHGDVVFAQRMLLPNRLSGRIPIVAAIGDEAYRRHAVEEALAAFAKAGLRAGLATYDADGGGRRTVSPTPGHAAIDALLLDPDLDAAVIACAPDAVERTGFPLRRCDLALIEDPRRFSWMERYADAIMAQPGPATAAAIGQLAQTFADPSEGGPLPVLEPLDTDDGGPFRLTVWRVRAMPRAWFWEQVGHEGPARTGLTTHDDLLAATRALATDALRAAGGPDLAPAFSYGELPAAWARVVFEATLPLPGERPDDARAALLAAVERVNAIAAMKAP